MRNYRDEILKLRKKLKNLKERNERDEKDLGKENEKEEKLKDKEYRFISDFAKNKIIQELLSRQRESLLRKSAPPTYARATRVFGIRLSLNTRLKLLLGLASAVTLIYWSAGLLPAGWLTDSRFCTLKKVVDGDSLWVRCAGDSVEVRLHCIDAPEQAQSHWGKDSTENLKRLLATKKLKVHAIETDRYGRTVADVYTADDAPLLINLEQVKQGQAAVYHQYCQDDRYKSAEKEARNANLGIWRKPGDHQKPWIFRQRSRG